MKLIMCDNIELCFFEKEGILTNLATGKFIAINYTTYFILSKIQEGLDYNNIIKVICEKFNIEEEVFKTDFDEMIKDMITLGILKYE